MSVGELPQAQLHHAVEASRADRLAVLAAVGLFLALALFGSRVHWVEEAGTAERDGYAAQADQLLSGKLPHDPYRPLLYPLLIAGATKLVGDSFTAARLLSNLAAASLAWLTWAFGRRLAGPLTGACAMLLLAVNPNLWIIGQHATTDMLFAALSAGCLLAALRYLQEPAKLPALLCGVALGLAAFTRANAILLLPALLTAWWLATLAARGARQGAQDVEARGRWRLALGHLGLALAATLLVLVPHWALRYADFGNAFYDENWKNLAFKLYGYPDWSYLDRVPFRSLGEIVRSDPQAVLRGAFEELWRFATAGAAQLFGTQVHVLAIAAGTAWALRLRATRRDAAWLVFALSSFLLAIALVFFTWGRLLLLLLPGAYALSFVPCHAAERRSRLTRATLITVAAGLVLLLGVKTFAYRIPAFVARHPYGEVAVLRDLEARLPSETVLAGSSPFLGRYLHDRYLALPDAFGEEVRRPALYFAALERWVRANGAEWLVIGPVDLRSRPVGLLGAIAPVPWLRPAGAQRGVMVWQVVDPSKR